jgi:hypothetical protein
MAPQAAHSGKTLLKLVEQEFMFRQSETLQCRPSKEN